MCGSAVKRITYGEYMKKREEICKKAYNLLEDIQENSTEVYYVETLFRDDVYLYAKIPFASGCFKKIKDVRNFVKKNTPPEEWFKKSCFWRITRYISYEKMGSYKCNNLGFMLTLDYTAENVLDVYVNEEYWSMHGMEARKSFLDDWEKYWGEYRHSCPVIVECPFREGDILKYSRPWDSRGQYYVYIGETEQLRYIDGALLLETDDDMYTKQIRNSPSFDAAMLKKVNKAECPELKRKTNLPENMTKMTVNELRVKVNSFLKKARKTVFTDCDEREIITVENVFREGTYTPSHLTEKKGLYKNYKSANGAMVDYPFSFLIDSDDASDKTIKDFMYFSVKKHDLNQENKYTELWNMKFNTDAELLDISFSKQFERRCFDSKQMEVYEEWKALKKSMNVFLAEQFQYGDILTFAMKPLYRPREFIYLGQADNRCRGLFRHDDETVFYETVDELCPTGMGAASLWLNIKKAESSDSDLKKVSEFLKTHPEAEDEIFDLADDESPGTYIPLEDILDFIKKFKE